MEVNSREGACRKMKLPLMALVRGVSEMRQHSHSHAGGKCEHEVAGIGSRYRSPSPPARYAPIPTAEELLALGQSIRSAKLAEDGQRNQEHPEVQITCRPPRIIVEHYTLPPLLLTLQSPRSVTLYQVADNDTDTWGETPGDVPMKPIITCPNPQSSKQVP
jgi:hypothetical protein